MSAQSGPGSAVARERVDAVPRLRSRHLLSVADLTPEEIQELMDANMDKANTPRAKYSGGPKL